MSFIRNIMQLGKSLKDPTSRKEREKWGTRRKMGNPIYVGARLVAGLDLHF
jgi:hypothetical protein